MQTSGKRTGQRTTHRVTLEDIARRCNVSKATVSRVLNDRLNEFPVSEEMIRRVKKAAEELDYKPNRLARAIRNRQTHLIGLSCIHMDDLNPQPEVEVSDNQVLGQYTNVILSHPDFKDYDLVIHDRKEVAGRRLKPIDFKSDLLDGIIYLTPTEGHSEFLEVASNDFPVILLGQSPGAEERVPCIDINNRKMAKRAVEHLIDIGRSNILMLIPEKLQDINCIKDRLQGYRDALADNGTHAQKELIHTVRCLREEMVSFFQKLPGFGDVDAIFCASDDLAAFCIEPLKSMGYRMPEDIALFGFGNTPISQLTSPTLSSVDQHPEKQVHAAIDLLLKILNKEIPYEPGFHEIESNLVIRESTAGSSQS